MDPDQALEDILRLSKQAQDEGLNHHEQIRLGHLIDSLNEWLEGKGFLPSRWSV